MTLDGTRFVSRDDLADELENEIVTGKLAIGAKLPSERKLAERYGVSRPIVREALRSLAERHLVEILPARGTFVRDARSSDAASQLSVHFRRTQATPRDLVEARSTLECAAAGLAAARATEEDIALMTQALVHLDGGGDVVDQARHDLAFHYAVTRAAHNPVLESMFAAVTQPTVELMLRSLLDAQVRDGALSLHHEILQAICRQDARHARDAMQRHLAVAARFYGDDLDRSVESVARRELARLLAPGVTLDDLLAATTPETKGGHDGRAGWD